MAIEKIEDTTLPSHETSDLPVLEHSNTVSSPPTAHLTQKTDEFAQWARAGELATAAAHAFLRAHGAGIIYGCDSGGVCEELPDGTVIIHPPGEIPAILLANSEAEASAL